MLKEFTHDQRLLQGRPRLSAGGDEALCVQDLDQKPYDSLERTVNG